MKLLNYKFLPLHLLFITGILAEYYLRVPYYILTGSFLVSVTALYFFKNRAATQFIQKPFFTIAALVLFFLLGSLVMKLHSGKAYKTHYTHLKNYQENQLWYFKIVNPEKKTARYHRFTAEVIQMDSLKASGKIMLYIKADSLKSVYSGDVLALQTKLQPIKKMLNPGLFNYENYLAKKQIYHQVYTNFREATILTKETSLHSLAARLQTNIRLKLKKQGFANNELAIINALLLGYRLDVSKEMYADFASAGVIHILAISGLHIGILLFFLSFIFKPFEQLKNGSLYKSLLIILLLWCFAFFTGLSPSVVRAVAMFSFFAYALNRKKQTNTTHVLIVSMFFILLFNPLFVFDVGFQLSYTAVFAIIWIQPLIFKQFRPKFILTKYLWSILSVTLAAQLGLLPLSLFYFHQFPGLFFVSNLVILPFLGFMLGFGLLIVVLLAFDWLPGVFVEVYSFIIKILHEFVSWVAQQEAFIFRDIYFDGYMLLVSYLVLISFIVLIKNFSRQKLVAFSFVSLLFLGVFFLNHLAAEKKDTFIIFHENQQTLLGHHKAKKLVVYSSTNKKPEANYTIKNYGIQYPINSITKSKIPSMLTFKKVHLVVLDTLHNSIPKNGYILLRNSPKINLERLIEQYHPKVIIADGSNYKSVKIRWEKTCVQKKTPFHDTSKKGAFIINR